MITFILKQSLKTELLDTRNRKVNLASLINVTKNCSKSNKIIAINILTAVCICNLKQAG